MSRDLLAEAASLSQRVYQVEDSVLQGVDRPCSPEPFPDDNPNGDDGDDLAGSDEQLGGDGGNDSDTANQNSNSKVKTSTRQRKPHLQGRFSGRLATKDDEKRLVEECRLLGPLLGGVGKRGDKSRLTLAKIVRGIASGEIRKYCDERELKIKLMRQKVTLWEQHNRQNLDGMKMENLRLRKELDLKTRTLQELEKALAAAGIKVETVAAPMEPVSAVPSMALYDILPPSVLPAGQGIPPVVAASPPAAKPPHSLYSEELHALQRHGAAAAADMMHHPHHPHTPAGLQQSSSQQQPGGPTGPDATMTDLAAVAAAVNAPVAGGRGIKLPGMEDPKGLPAGVAAAGSQVQLPGLPMVDTMGVAAPAAALQQQAPPSNGSLLSLTRVAQNAQAQAQSLQAQAFAHAAKNAELSNQAHNLHSKMHFISQAQAEVEQKIMNLKNQVVHLHAHQGSSVLNDAQLQMEQHQLMAQQHAAARMEVSAAAQRVEMQAAAHAQAQMRAQAQAHELQVQAQSLVAHAEQLSQNPLSNTSNSSMSQSGLPDVGHNAVAAAAAAVAAHHSAAAAAGGMMDGLPPNQSGQEASQMSNMHGNHTLPSSQSAARLADHSLMARVASSGTVPPSAQPPSSSHMHMMQQQQQPPNTPDPLMLQGTPPMHNMVNVPSMRHSSSSGHLPGISPHHPTDPSAAAMQAQVVAAAAAASQHQHMQHAAIQAQVAAAAAAAAQQHSAQSLQSLPTATGPNPTTASSPHRALHHPHHPPPSKHMADVAPQMSSSSLHMDGEYAAARAAHSLQLSGGGPPGGAPQGTGMEGASAFQHRHPSMPPQQVVSSGIPTSSSLLYPSGPPLDTSIIKLEPNLDPILPHSYHPHYSNGPSQRPTPNHSINAMDQNHTPHPSLHDYPYPMHHQQQQPSGGQGHSRTGDPSGVSYLPNRGGSMPVNPSFMMDQGSMAASGMHHHTQGAIVDSGMDSAAGAARMMDSQHRAALVQQQQQHSHGSGVSPHSDALQRQQHMGGLQAIGMGGMGMLSALELDAGMQDNGHGVSAQNMLPMKLDAMHASHSV